MEDGSRSQALLTDGHAQRLYGTVCVCTKMNVGSKKASRRAGGQCQLAGRTGVQLHSLQTAVPSGRARSVGDPVQ